MPEKKGRSGRKRTPEVRCEHATGACRVAAIMVHALKCLAGLSEARGCWRRRMLRACTSRHSISHSCTYDAFARRCGLGSPPKCQPQRPGNTPRSSISNRLCVQRAPHPHPKRSHTLAPERHVHMLAVCSMCGTLVSGALFRVMPTIGPCI